MQTKSKTLAHVLAGWLFTEICWDFSNTNVGITGLWQTKNRYFRYRLLFLHSSANGLSSFKNNIAQGLRKPGTLRMSRNHTHALTGLEKFRFEIVNLNGFVTCHGSVEKLPGNLVVENRPSLAWVSSNADVCKIPPTNFFDQDPLGSNNF